MLMTSDTTAILCMPGSSPARHRPRRKVRSHTTRPPLPLPASYKIYGDVIRVSRHILKSIPGEQTLRACASGVYRMRLRHNQVLVDAVSARAHKLCAAGSARTAAHQDKSVHRGLSFKLADFVCSAHWHGVTYAGLWS